MSLRDGPFGTLKVPLTWTAAVALIVAVVAAGAFLLGDRRETLRAGAYDQVRRVADQAAAPVGKITSAPVGFFRGIGEYVGSYIDAANENRRLKAELAADAHLNFEVQQLRNENDQFRALMGVKTDPPIDHVFARTLTDARGPFSNTRLADAGSDKGVTEGNPVLGQHGVVGRVTGVSRSASRIMLLTDTESRTPVMIARTNARAILTGDGGPTPKLAYLRSHDPVVEGDRVTTSGDGGVYPRGLPVGVVVKDLDGGWRVALDADAAPIDYVQIMLFRDFSQLLVKSALEPKTLPSTATAPADDAGPAVGAVKPAKPAADSAASSAAPKPDKPKPAAAKPGAAKPGGDRPSVDRPSVDRPAGDKASAKPRDAAPPKPHDADAAAHKPASPGAPHKPKLHDGATAHHADAPHPPPATHEDTPF